MFKKHSKYTERSLIEIVNNKNNINKCGECGSDYPTWASWNLGILLCGRCANLHKKVLSSGGPRGGPISKVKSLTLENWTDEQIERLRGIGNRTAKRRWNPRQVPFPHSDDEDEPVARYFRDKYIEGRFRDAKLDYDEYEGPLHSHSDRSGALTPATRSSRAGSMFSGGRSRAGSRSVPQLSHRRLTTFEQTQYPAQVAKMMAFGFDDRDAVLESLILSEGNFDFALEILEHDSKTNPTRKELPPQLPRRPTTTSSQTLQMPSISTAQTSAGSSTDWWSANPSVQLPQQTAQLPQQTAQQGPGQPQIYQYTDPVTGQVSYVDSNGQQYLDTNNPQHQQMLMQQTMPLPAFQQQLTQQATKQNILSLYNQQGTFTTGQAQNHSQPQITQQQQQQPTGFYAGYPAQAQVYMQPTVQQQTGIFQQPHFGQQWR